MSLWPRGLTGEDACLPNGTMQVRTLPGPPETCCPTSSANYPWGETLRPKPKSGLSTHAHFGANGLERQGQNDVPQLRDRLPQAWSQPQRHPTLPLPHLP